MAEPPSSRSRRRATLLASRGGVAASALFWLRFNAAPPRRGRLFPADLLELLPAARRRRRAAPRVRRAAALEPAPVRRDPGARHARRRPCSRRIPGSSRRCPPSVGAAAARSSSSAARRCLRGAVAAPARARRRRRRARRHRSIVARCLLGQSFWPPVDLDARCGCRRCSACVESLAQQLALARLARARRRDALQALAGFPQFALYSFQACGLYALLRS